MSDKIRSFITICFLMAYVLSSTGCAAGWFLLGAGTAATAAAVISDKDKEESREVSKEEPKEE